MFNRHKITIQVNLNCVMTFAVYTSTRLSSASRYNLEDFQVRKSSDSRGTKFPAISKALCHTKWENPRRNSASVAYFLL